MPANTKSTSRFKGLNNVTDPLRLSLGWLRKAVNIDITDTGAIERRSGYSPALIGNLSGAFSTDSFDRLYVVDDGALKRVNADMTTVTLRTGLADKPMFWEEVNESVYFTNGVDSGIITPGENVLPWAWPVPAAPTLLATAGDQPAGMYQVLCSFLLSDGRETGTGAVAEIYLGDKQALQISNIPQLAGARTQVYIAPANSTVFQLAFDTTATAMTWNAGADSLGVDELTNFYSPLPAGSTHPAFWQGRMYMLHYLPQENMTVVWASEPLGFHLFSTDSAFFMVPGEGTMLAASDGGLVIGTRTRIYGYDGDELQELATYGAVPGWSAVKDPDTKKIMFWSTRGLCSALPFVNVTDRQISVPPGLSAGAAIVSQNGEKRYVVALQKGGTAFNPRV